ncbi:MAG: hypothetical protein LBC29_05545 [Propionibacteriaceae bacterium]|jgi:hypothetical protein|nr:hypothetical protein [Propionibacteriaceae bacterium]
MTFAYNLVAYSISIGVLAAVIQVIDQFAVGKGGIGPFKAGGGWVSFQAWALLFLSGAFNAAEAGTYYWKGIIWTMISYALGICAAVAIFELAAIIGKTGFWAVPIALVIVCIPVLFLQLTSAPFNYVPALFCGAGVFFAGMSYFPSIPGSFKDGASKWSNYGQMAIGELFYCLLGGIAGVVTLWWASLEFVTKLN